MPMLGRDTALPWRKSEDKVVRSVTSTNLWLMQMALMRGRSKTLTSPVAPHPRPNSTEPTMSLRSSFEGLAGVLHSGATSASSGCSCVSTLAGFLDSD